MVTYSITGTDSTMLQISDGVDSVSFNAFDSSHSNGRLVDFTVKSDSDFGLEINDADGNFLVTPFIIGQNDEFRNNSQFTFGAIFIDKARNNMDGFGYLAIDLAPGQWVVYLLNDPYWDWFPKPEVPKKKKCFICFTYNTLLKVMPLVKDYTIIKTKRDKQIKIIRATHSKLGTVEFTENHPFIYNSQIVRFGKLVEINPNFTNIEIVNDNIDEVYNITSHKNIFDLSDDLCMIGAQRVNEEWSCTETPNYKVSRHINHIPHYSKRKFVPA
jgi:hypothetical protein